MKVLIHLESPNWKENKSCYFFSGIINDVFLKQEPKKESFYACIENGNNFVQLSVDQVRSKGLLYSINKGVIYISDSFNWIQDKVGLDYSCQSINQFLAGGLVVGANTFNSKIFSVESGTMVEINKETGGVNINKEFGFYSTIISNQKNVNEKLFDLKLSDELTKLIKPIALLSKTKKIVVPLSGGYDSRLLVCLLKKAGVTNVICFTYGKKHNKESITSKKIAEELNYDWYFIEYSKCKIKKFLNEDKIKELLDFVCNGTSLPHLQDAVAINELLSKGIINKGDVIVPGHSADFLGGTHIPQKFVMTDSISKKQLIDEILSVHFTSVNLNESDKSKLRTAIDDNYPETMSRFEAITCFEYFDWKERQSKYICNSCLVYEFFELNYYLPFWERDFIKFWETVPLDFRVDRMAFKSWIINFTDEFLNLKDNSNSGDNSKTRLFLSKWLDRLPGIVKELIVRFLRIPIYYRHPIGLGYFIPFTRLISYSLNGDYITGMLAKVYVKKVFSENGKQK